MTFKLNYVALRQTIQHVLNLERLCPYHDTTFKGVKRLFLSVPLGFLRFFCTGRSLLFWSNVEDTASGYVGIIKETGWSIGPAYGTIHMPGVLAQGLGYDSSTIRVNCTTDPPLQEHRVGVENNSSTKTVHIATPANGSRNAK